jgi:hypothetical protein
MTSNARGHFEIVFENEDPQPFVLMSDIAPGFSVKLKAHY